MKRGRNQRRRPGGGSNPNRALDSNGPDVRIRGTANQIYDKYQALARDASSAGDRIKAESYLQHAEHYFRLIRAAQPAPTQQPQATANGDDEQPAVEGADGAQQDNQRSNQNRDNRRPRPQRQNGGGDSRPNNSASAAEQKPEPEKPATDTPEASAPEPVEAKEAPPAEEEKKPRRKRAPRKSVKRAETDGDTPDEKAPATATAD